MSQNRRSKIIKILLSLIDYWKNTVATRVFLGSPCLNLISLILKCLKGVDDANATRCTPLISHGNRLFS